jgi:tetratricopeptide (TPR) repeat protein
MKIENCVLFLCGCLVSIAFFGCATRPTRVPVVYVCNVEGSQWLPVQQYPALPNRKALGAKYVVGTIRSRPVLPSRDIAAEDAWIYRAPNSNETKQEALKIAALGIVFFRERNYARSEVYTRRALELIPGHQCLLTYHAACLVRLGNVSAARAEFEQAISISPDLEDAQQARTWIEKLRGN